MRGAIPRAVLALAVIAVIGTLIPVAPAAAQNRTGVLEVVSQTPYIRAGETFRITVRTTGLDLDLTRINVAVGRVVGGVPVSESRAQLRASATTEQQLVESLLNGNVVSRRPVLARSAADANGLLTVTIPTRGPAATTPATPATTDPPPISLAPGVWPVAIEVRHPNQAPQTLLTHLVMLPEAPASSPLTVTVVVPLSASRPALRPDESVVLDALDRSRLRTLMEQVRSFPSVVLAVSPQLVDALGRSTDPADVELLSSLRSLVTANAVIALPYVDLDVEAWREAGLVDEVRGLFSAGRVTLTNVLGVEPAGDTIITPPSTTADTLSFLAEMGYSRFVFGAEQLEELRPQQWPAPITKTFVVRDAVGEPRAGFSTDPELRRLFAGDSVLNAHRLVADLSAAWFDGAAAASAPEREERRGVVVIVPDDWSASAQFLNVVVASLTANPIIRVGGFGPLFNTSPASKAGDRTPFTLVDGVLERRLVPSPPRALGIYPAQLRELNARLGSFQSMLPTSASGDPTLRILLLISGDQRLDAAQREQYLDVVSDAISGATSGLSFAPSSAYTLTSRTDTIAIVVENSSRTALVGRIELRTDPRVEFPDLARGIGGTWLIQDVQLAPGPNRFDVRVRTRTSGESSFEAVLTSPDGGLGPLATTRLRVRSVVLSGVGLALSVVALLVLLTWWARHHRARRRAGTRTTTVS
jgi:hypothetical protein